MPHLLNLLVGNLRTRVAISVDRGDDSTTLKIHVPDVIQTGSKEKVARVYAWRIVAAVQHPQTLLNASVLTGIRAAVRDKKAPAIMQLSVATVIGCGVPGPAAF